MRGKVRIGILGSGKGSNCRAILQKIRGDELPADARLVISDVSDAPILEIAREFGVPGLYLSPGQFRTRLDIEAELGLVELLHKADVEFVVLAGFMRVLKQPMLRAFPRRIINIHPSLLPKYPGLRAWQQALDAGEKITGVTVHFVDEQVDHGEIIAQKRVPIRREDTADSLHARIQAVEHELYPAALAELFRNYSRSQMASDFGSRPSSS